MSRAHPIEANYLLVGAGASAMAFADTLLTDDAHARIVIVDASMARAGTGTTRVSLPGTEVPAA